MANEIVLICVVICFSLIVLAGLAAYTWYKIQANKEQQMNYREEERTRRKEAELRNERYDMQLAMGNPVESAPQEEGGLASLLTPENISMFMSLLGSRGGGSGVSVDGNNTHVTPAYTEQSDPSPAGSQPVAYRV